MVRASQVRERLRVAESADGWGVGASTPLEITEWQSGGRNSWRPRLSMLAHGHCLPAPPEAAALIRDSYLSFPHYDTGDPVGVPEVEGRALAILSGGGKLSCPAPQSRRRENYI